MNKVKELFEKTRELPLQEISRMIQELMHEIGEASFVEQLYQWDANKNKLSAELLRTLRCFRHMDDAMTQQIIDHYGDHIELDHQLYQDYFAYIEAIKKL